nr:EOG090X0BM2 [Simocephalus serrulatus]
MIPNPAGSHSNRNEKQKTLGCYHGNGSNADECDSLLDMFIRTLVLKTVKNVFGPKLRKYCSDNPRKKWKIMFFGTDGFALRSLEELHKAMQAGMLVSELSVVVPAPKPHPCLVAKYAMQHNLPISIWPLPKDPVTSNCWDVGVVASFGHLIPQRVINIFPLGMLNIHASLLPRWRGAAPIIHAIMNGDTETGVTVMRIKPHHFDVGDIVKQKSLSIDPDTTALQLTDRLAEMGASLLVGCLSDLHYHLDRCVPQPTEGITLAPKIDAQSLSRIDWRSMNASQIYNRWRALRHLFKLQTIFHGVNVKLNNVEPPTTKPPATCQDVPLTPGRIVLDRQRNLLFVGCSEDWVAISQVTLHRRPVMSALDFFNGYLQRRSVAQHYFDVCHNAMSSIPVQAFQHIPELRELKLNGNPLIRLSGQPFAAATKLVRLEIANCQLNSIDQKAFHKCWNGYGWTAT